MSRTSHRRLGAALVLLVALAMGGCGDDDPAGPGADAILGSWQVTAFIDGIPVEITLQRR